MTVTLPSKLGEPTWEMAVEFPHQGHWLEADYLRLTTNRLVEFADGVLEFPPMPSLWHHRLLRWLAFRLAAHLGDRGEVLPAGYPLRLRSGLFREPDLIVGLAATIARWTGRYAEAADLVMEIVSPDDPKRDWLTKRTDYATAGVPEYWIVDPDRLVVAVLTLPAGATEYVETRYVAGQVAESVVLAGFRVDVDELFASATMGV